MISHGRARGELGFRLVIRWLRQVPLRGRWVFVEWKVADCRDCGTFLGHSWNNTFRWTKGSLCTVCVARHIGGSPR